MGLLTDAERIERITLYEKVTRTLKEQLKPEELLRFHEFMWREEDDGFYWNLSEALIHVFPKEFDRQDGLAVRKEHEVAPF